jgi:predicted nucleic acid-binding protein
MIPLLKVIAGPRLVDSLLARYVRKEQTIQEQHVGMIEELEEFLTNSLVILGIVLGEMTEQVVGKTKNAKQKIMVITITLGVVLDALMGNHLEQVVIMIVIKHGFPNYKQLVQDVVALKRQLSIDEFAKAMKK